MSDLDKHIEQLRACRPIPEADVRIPHGDPHPLTCNGFQMHGHELIMIRSRRFATRLERSCWKRGMFWFLIHNGKKHY
jgi:hypothetical protein